MPAKAGMSGDGTRDLKGDPGDRVAFSFGPFGP